MSTAYFNDIGFGKDDITAKHMGDLVNISVQEHGDKPAFSCILPTGHSHTITYTELGALSDAVAVYLREELKLIPGDVVAIQSPNILAYPVLAFGIFKAGLTITNVNPLYTADEVNHQLKDSNAKVWFVVDVFGDRVNESIAGTNIEKIFTISVVDFFPALQRNLLSFAMKYLKKAVPPFEGQLAGTLTNVIKQGSKHIAEGVDLSSYTKDTTLDSVALFQYTGGTTGRSKGAALTHGNVVSNVFQFNKLEDGLDIEEGDLLLLVLPLYHVYALAVGGLSSMFRGVHVLLVAMPRPLSNLQKAFEKFNITILPGVNALYLGLLQEKWFTEMSHEDLRFCSSGAAPLQPATAEAWQKLTGCEIYEGYGLTESTCVVSVMPKNAIRKGSCGIPIPGVGIRIVGDGGVDMPRGESGELWISGPQIMKGYLNNEEATKENIVDGWLKTGDVAKLDEDGYLYIVDRLKDMVLVSGFNVYPVEIDSILTQDDRVAEAAAVGIPDDETGERVIACVVKADASLSEEDVVAHCKEHLTRYKVPKTVIFMDELPKSPVGKVLRRELREIVKTMKINE